MGLDSVEILMKVGTIFGIQIPNREAEKIITIGDFHNAVFKTGTSYPASRLLHNQPFFKIA